MANASTTYAVVSPIWTAWYSGDLWPMEMPEDTCAYVEVEARTRHEARQKAIKTPEFRDWVDMQRGDRKHPLTGLQAYPKGGN